jgi:2-dehydro-3-deoxygluconokinase
MVLSFGELLLRLSRDTTGRWLDKSLVNIYMGGNEINIISALVQWRMPVCFCTVLPDNFIAREIVKQLAEQNIDTSAIIYYGDKIGLYYLEHENLLTGESIIYDRLHSSFYDLQPGVINWDNVFNGVRWFHFSSLSAGLHENIAAVCKEALAVCARKNITVSAYMHHQPQIWLNKNKPAEVMPELLQYCDVFISDVQSINAMLATQYPAALNMRRDDTIQLSKKVSEEFIKQFQKCKIVANNFCSYGSAIEMYGTAFTNNNLYISASYKSNNIVDKAGSGDCFVAGLIYGIYNHLPFQQVINFAAAAGFQKLFVKGDRINKTAEEIKSFILHY